MALAIAASTRVDRTRPARRPPSEEPQGDRRDGTSLVARAGRRPGRGGRDGDRGVRHQLRRRAVPGPGPRRGGLRRGGRRRDGTDDRARHRHPRGPPRAPSARRARRWACAPGAVDAGRVAAVLGAMMSFYVTYLAYREPQGPRAAARPDAASTAKLADPDRAHVRRVTTPPSSLQTPARDRDLDSRAVEDLRGLHRVPAADAGARPGVRPRSRRPASSTPTALSINWVLGAGSYLVLPSLGPVLAQSGDVPRPSRTRRSTHLQNLLLERIASPSSTDPANRGATEPSRRSRRCTSP